MKTYRVVLSSLGTVLVEAESCEEHDNLLVFYRNGLACAQYARPLVKACEERQIAPPPFPVAEREDFQAP